MKTNKKISCGVVCYRNSISGKQRRNEFIVVKKRITYAYSKFVNGLYNPEDKELLMEIFNCMTIDEKLLILSFDFDAIWRHIWLSREPIRHFIPCSRKFEDAFMHDGGTRLKKMIWASKKSGQLRWEIPKGRKSHNGEMDLQCAVREFAEETGIEKENYFIYPSLKRTETYSDDGKYYMSIYYGALAKNDIKLYVSSKRQEQAAEICDIRWVTLDELKILDTHSYEKIARVVRPLINALKKRNKY